MTIFSISSSYLVPFGKLDFKCRQIQKYEVNRNYLQKNVESEFPFERCTWILLCVTLNPCYKTHHVHNILHNIETFCLIIVQTMVKIVKNLQIIIEECKITSCFVYNTDIYYIWTMLRYWVRMTLSAK